MAVPEFDGRNTTVPPSFKEIDDDGLISCADLSAAPGSRAWHPARTAVLWSPPPTLVTYLRPHRTKHARIGNAVAWTPASAALLQAMRAQRGYRAGDLPGVESVATR